VRVPRVGSYGIRSMQHDAVNAAVLAAGNSATRKLGGIARQTLPQRSQVDRAGMAASRGRSVVKFIPSFPR